MSEGFFYPTVADVLAFHEDVVDEDGGSEPGVRSRRAIESALTYVSVGSFGRAPDTVHEKAAHLMRLLVAAHPFVDGNKRTALNTVAVFYELNGYEFDYDDESVRELLRGFATDAASVDMEDAIAYCSIHARSTEE